MIELRHNALEFSFPQVHDRARCTIAFQRTLRIPDDNQPYPLPAGLGRFPLHHVDDHWQRLPPAWEQHGGVFMPMYQSEALWVDFSSNDHEGYPCAIKVAAGKINAVSGEPWGNGLIATPQGYLVIPTQFWLDGYAVGQGLIRQFVAMPLGAGFSAEEQLTGQGVHGGLQLVVYPMKPERYAVLKAQRRAARQVEVQYSYLPGLNLPMPPTEMALAPGGLMRQQINRDPYGLDAWDQTAGSRCFVHLVNSLTYVAITGISPPHPPLTAADYARARMPWFELYHEDHDALPGSHKLAGLDSYSNAMVSFVDPPLAASMPPGQPTRGVTNGAGVLPVIQQISRMPGARTETASFRGGVIACSFFIGLLNTHRDCVADKETLLYSVSVLARDGQAFSSAISA